MDEACGVKALGVETLWVESLSVGSTRLTRGIRTESLLKALQAMRKFKGRRRCGQATLDYVLLMGIVLPLAGFVLWAAPRMMNRVYEFTTALTGMPS